MLVAFDLDGTLLVGDSLIDLQTSRDAGVKICLARCGFGFVDIAPQELAGDDRVADTPMAIAAVAAQAVGYLRNGSSYEK